MRKNSAGFNFRRSFFNDLELAYQGGYEQWHEWYMEQVDNCYEIEHSILEAGTELRIKPSSGEKTAVDYMYDYNIQVLDAACGNFARFSGGLINEQFYDKKRELDETLRQKWHQTNERADA